MERVRTRGMFLVEGAGKFFLRGVAYGPFRPNHFGEPFPEKSVAERDLALLRQLGANTIRLYHVPPGWLCELADGLDLRLLVGVPWAQHVRFLDSSRSRQQIRSVVREAAHSLRESSNVMGLLIGNEIPPQVVRWYERDRIQRFLEELADEVRQVDPEVLVSYANFPMTEYLECEGLDFLAVNVYLHREAELRRYVARLQNLAAFRPLVLTEFGIDSLREGECSQAEILERTIDAAAELGCAGTVVFSFTDEWHTGGFEIEDWAFGLVTKEREPKPAFAAIRRAYRRELPPRPDPAPKVSVVVCAYQAERTLEECLDSLRRIRYPDYEVIVVDDGSTDGTFTIAERYSEFRLIRQENRGLSAARNAGILAARGEVVAFTDSDCAVDPDWLTFLIQRLASGEFVGVGGPNLPPPEDDWLPEVVARSPGGPTHVLLTDWQAEHIPGCNMAFWRDRLLEIGLFDPVFRTAGDDVDVCWRFQNASHKLGFAAAAMVWHHRRHTVRAYLRQQRGYGHAEALLYFKHPYRFNPLGNSRWLGRIYTDLGSGFLRGRPLIYGGPFGTGLFQTLYEPPSTLLRHLPATLEWNLVALGLAGLGAASAAIGFQAPILWMAGLMLFATSLGSAGAAALRANLNGLPALRSRALVALLTYLGPLVRSVERNRHHVAGLAQVEPIRFREPHQAPAIDLWRRNFSLAYWNETGINKEACLSALIDFFSPRGYPVIPDEGWSRWDLSLFRCMWVRAELKVLIENHGGLKRQVDVQVSLRQSGLAKIVKGIYAGWAIVAAAAGAWPVAALLAGAAIVHEGALWHQAYRLGRTLYQAVEVSFGPLPLDPLEEQVDLGSPLV